MTKQIKLTYGAKVYKNIKKEQECTHSWFIRVSADKTVRKEVGKLQIILDRSFNDPLRTFKKWPIAMFGEAKRSFIFHLKIKNKNDDEILTKAVWMDINIQKKKIYIRLPQENEEDNSSSGNPNENERSSEAENEEDNSSSGNPNENERSSEAEKEEDNSPPHSCVVINKEANVKPKKDYNSRFKCYFCCRKFGNVGEQRRHEGTHEEQIFCCQICKKNYKNRKSFVSHKGKHA